MKVIEQEIAALKNTINEMWALVHQQIYNAGEAMLTGDKELAYKVLSRERRVNAFELKIDSDCEDIIALYAPVAIDLRFAVRGMDASGSTPVSFQLGEGATRMPGVGKVVAYIDASGPVAEARALPGDASPFLVPDGTLGTAAALVTPGTHRIRLELRYNDGTLVTPQGIGEVSVRVQ